MKPLIGVKITSSELLPLPENVKRKSITTEILKMLLGLSCSSVETADLLHAPVDVKPRDRFLDILDIKRINLQREGVDGGIRFVERDEKAIQPLMNFRPDRRGGIFLFGRRAPSTGTMTSLSTWIRGQWVRLAALLLHAL